MAYISFDGDLLDDENLSPEDIDDLKAALAYLLMDNTGIEPDEVYSLVFHDGSKIIWH